MIKIEHLVKYYGTNCAVDDVGFEIGEGEIVGLLGPNGAGKSTTMNILTGCLSSTSGVASVDGIDILKDPIAAKRKIGYLPEQPPLYLDMTVDEYLKFAYALKGCKLDRETHLAAICETVRVSDVRNKLIRTLSKGYRQRVGIAQALVGDPKVIIFDEPTVGLDPKQIIEIRNLIRGLGRNHTVILSTHILQEVQAVCDRIIIINKGRIVADEKTENISNVMTASRRFRLSVAGPQREILAALRAVPGVSSVEATNDRDEDAYTYLVECNAGTDVRKKVFYTVAERGWAIVSMENVGMNLEDVFLSVVNRSEEGERRGRSTRRTREEKRQSIGDALFEDAERRRKASSESTDSRADD